MEGIVPSCMYCQSPCEADLFAMEPTWQCSWCQALTHVRCYQQCHHSGKDQLEGSSPRGSSPRTSFAHAHTLVLADGRTCCCEPAAHDFMAWP